MAAARSTPSRVGAGAKAQYWPPSAGSGTGVDPEAAQLRLVLPEEDGAVALHLPLAREHAAREGEEAGEQARRVLAGEVRVVRDVDLVVPRREGERPDAVVVEDPERAGAEVPEALVASSASTTRAGDGEASVPGLHE